MTSVGCSIPLDLMFEILLKLPAESVLRFRYVSKSWRSIISSQQFIDAFMSLSLSRPYLVLASKHFKDDLVLFLSSPHQNYFMSNSSLVPGKYGLALPDPRTFYNHICNSVRGFILFCQSDQFMVHNLTTRQVIWSTKENYNYYGGCSMYLGYDPKSNLYKVLRLMSQESGLNFEHSVCTLRRQEPSHSWRTIKANIPYKRGYQNGVCIDGVVYYEYDHRKICSFDVGSEVLRFIETPGDLSYILNSYCYINTGKLANYMGKLAVYSLMNTNGFKLWILDDVKNQVWSEKNHIFQHSTILTSRISRFRFEGITGSGEIVFVPTEFSDPFEIFCCDVEKKMERMVRLKRPLKFRSHQYSLLFPYVDNIAFL